jgi:alpha-galactosidase
VFHSQRLLAKMIELEYGIKDVKKEEVRLNVLGLNHFTWITYASYKTYDLMPLFKKYALEYAEKGLPLRETDTDPDNYFRNINKVCFDLFNRYGTIACSGDRHLAEFMPPWYLKDPATVKSWGFDLTPVPYRKERRAEKLKQRERIVSGQERFELENSGEEGTELMKALLGLNDVVTNVNIPNVGQNEGLPLGAVVESNAVFELNAVRPAFAGKLPSPVNILSYKHAANQIMLIEAGIKKDAGLAFHAFLSDNLVAPLSAADAEKLFTEMTQNTKEYLKGWSL